MIKQTFVTEFNKETNQRHESKNIKKIKAQIRLFHDFKHLYDYELSHKKKQFKEDNEMASVS